MSDSALSLAQRFRSFYLTTGLVEITGGIDAYDAGVEDLKAGLAVVAADLANAERLGVALADAVLDPVRFPHAARMHGMIRDLLDMNVPSELERWIWKIARMGPTPDVPEIRRAIAVLAVSARNPFHRILGRFALFELLCFSHRLTLKRDRIQLELMNGRRSDIEVLAEAEVDAACAIATSSSNLLEIDDPLATIEKMAMLALARHVELLRRELSGISVELHDQIERREQILAAAARVEPGDAVLILNETAEEFGEERFAAIELRQVHPLLLADLTDAAIYKRVERLPDKVSRGSVSANSSFGDVIIAAMREVVR